MKDLAKYSFANAKIRAMLSYLIEQPVFNSLLELKDKYEVFESLKKTPYGEVVEKLSAENIKMEALEQEFLRNDLKVYDKIYDALSTKREKDFVALLKQRYELEQLKVFLRIWHKKTLVDLEDYIVEKKISYDIDYKKIVAAESIEEIILLLDDTVYKRPLMKVKDRYKEKRSCFYLEAALDVDYYDRLLNCIDKFSPADKKIARKILGVEVDIENINWLIRMRKYYSMGLGDMLDWVLPGGEWINKDTVRKFYSSDGLTKVVDSVAFGPYARLKDLVQENTTELERFLYGFMMREVKKALGGFPFTIGTVLGYLILKRNETKNIISLINAKHYGWKKEEIAPILNQ